MVVQNRKQGSGGGEQHGSNASGMPDTIVML